MADLFSGRKSPVLGAVIALPLCSVLAALVGCQAELAAPSHPLPQAIDPARLDSDLRLLVERSLGQNIGLATRIAASAQEPRVRRVSLNWRLRSLDNYMSILAIEDPRQAFVREWFLVVRLRQWLTDGTGRDVFGADHEKVLALVQRTEADVMTLGRRYFTPAAIDATRDDIEAAAKSYRDQAPFEPPEVLAPEPKGGLVAILAAPLLPATGMAEVAPAINRFTDVAREFTLAVQHMPERARWQSELLLLEMESTGPVPAMVREAQELRECLKAMPAAGREEIEKALAAMDKSMPAYRTTVAEVKEAAEGARAAVEAARKGMQEFHEASKQGGQLSGQLTEAAKALGATASELRGLLADYRQIMQMWNAPSSAASQPTSMPSVQDCRAAAEAAYLAAKEARALLHDVGQADDETRGVGRASAELRGTMNSILWRSLVLVAATFVLALAYKRIVRSWAAKRDGRG